ncbi:SET domain-containing protein-lysine N-methyltransferase [Pseudenhygromyxa sp. WMMC2535]|uniref:SET domain-containing protein-lysine N-methyltransferase n=1 Tax=Pseudenhygromyxa sp. WMMC2535 TaxID=2712867 RepID=UPI0015531DBB|nr:SET domain-containing protein-lysine N-methyltransferase [Pseudenhygromyxa sp. WMMC2535]NVB36468.1 SET domain-containing protein-lysine N-methyltransferase [Pseudenhygromyxa sp. WMMC2535]
MIHPDTELFWAGPEVGFGVRATRAIPRGTLTWVRCALDIVLDDASARAMGPSYAALLDRYAYLEADGSRVLCWDHGRYVNHHCDANCRGLGPGAQIAVADIAAGEELTCDYGECNLPWDLACACGSPRCRGTVSPRDLQTHAPRWDEQLREALAEAPGLLQPLLVYIQNDDLVEVLAGTRRPPGIRSLAYPGPRRPLVEHR